MTRGPAATSTRRPYGCALAAAALVLLVALFWSAGGIYGLLHIMGGRNPWRYIAPTPARRAETMARAETIIAALERWRARHGTYPETLGQLVPAELTSIPRATIGDRRWNYTRPELRRFVLDFFEGHTYEHSWWDSNAARWQGDH